MQNYDPHLGSFIAKALSFSGFLLTITAIISLFQLKIIQFIVAGFFSLVLMHLARVVAIRRYHRELKRNAFRRF